MSLLHHGGETHFERLPFLGRERKLRADQEGIVQALLAAAEPLPDNVLPCWDDNNDKRVKAALESLYEDGRIARIYRRISTDRVFEIRTTQAEGYPFNVVADPAARRRVNFALGLTYVDAVQASGNMRAVQHAMSTVNLLSDLILEPVPESSPAAVKAPLALATGTIAVQAGMHAFRPIQF